MTDVADKAMDERYVDRLVARASRGDAGAFGALYDAYADRVYAYVVARVRHHHDAEDVTVTVFLKAWEAIPSYDRRGLPFGAWLFRIARNAVIDHVRRRARAPAIAEVVEAEGLAAPDRVDEEVLIRAEASRMRECVSRLGDEQAEVIVLRFFWGYDIAHTARATGRTEGAVKALQHRAVRNLAKMLREEGRDGQG